MAVPIHGDCADNLKMEPTAEHRRRLEHIARTCPVAQSLSPDVTQEVEFVYLE